jgi:hypothetical protein
VAIIGGLESPQHDCDIALTNGADGEPAKVAHLGSVTSLRTSIATYLV